MAHRVLGFALTASEGTGLISQMDTQPLKVHKSRFSFGFLRRKGAECPPDVSAKLGLSSYLGAETIQAHLASGSKNEIIFELLDVLARNGLVKDVPEARRAVLEREGGMSTGMQYGLAVPHARTKAVDRLTCVLGVKREGVDFGSLDGKPSRIFVLVLFPDKTTTITHLQFMATISRMLDEPTREQILSCDTAQQIYDMLAGREES